MSSVLSSLPLYFSFLPFFSFFFFPFIFSFSHTSPFLFSLSPSLFSPPFPLQNFKEKWAGIENIRGPSFSCVIHIYIYICIFAYCVLYNIAGDLKRNIASSVGRRGEEKCRFTEEDGGNIRNSLLRGDNKGRRGGGRERGNLSRTSEIRWRRSTTAFFSPVFLPLFLLFLLFLSFFFLSLFPRKITGPECRTNENGLFVIISSRDARISLHFPSVLVIFRILCLYIYKFFLSLFLS